MTTPEKTEAHCPVCDETFQTDVVGTYTVTGRESDFRMVTEGDSPLPHGVWVCPACHYAGEPVRFGEHAMEIEPIREWVESAEAYLEEIELPPSPVEAWILAARIGKRRGGDPRAVADRYLNAAWLAVDEGDEEAARMCRRQAYEAFSQALAELDDPLEQTYVRYMLGELARLVGDFEPSLKHFREAFEGLEQVDVAEEKQFFASLIHRQAWMADEENADRIALHAPSPSDSPDRFES